MNRRLLETQAKAPPPIPPARAKIKALLQTRREANRKTASDMQKDQPPATPDKMPLSEKAFLSLAIFVAIWLFLISPVGEPVLTACKALMGWK